MGWGELRGIDGEEGWWDEVSYVGLMGRKVGGME